MIRRATEADLEAIVWLENSCLGPDAWSEGLIREGLGDGLPMIRYLLAEADRAVVGHAVASCVPDVAELQRITVDPSHRRKGVASELLEAVIAEARGAGADRLLLEVRDDNSGAIAFYAAAGFQEIDRRKKYYRDGAAAVVMRLPLFQGCGGG